jgi:DNA-binding NarL/FixJ family response regulator
VDDDALVFVRGALSMILDSTNGIIVVGEVADEADVPVAVSSHAPDVVLMDLRMPRVDGIVATCVLRARAAPPDVIVPTTFDTDEYVLNALCVGASGFLLKDTLPAQIVDAVRKVAAGYPILSPAITRRLMDRVATEAGTRNPEPGMGERLVGFAAFP